MERKREKCKVRWRLGRNATRCMWVRTEKNSRKWRSKQTGRLVSKGRPVKRLTRRNGRKNVSAMGGGSSPRRGKLGKWRKKYREGRIGMGRRYGGVNSAELGRLRKPRNLGLVASKLVAGKGTVMSEELPKAEKRESVRWNRERRAEMRRWRSGRVPTRKSGVERMKKGGVCLVTENLVSGREARKNPGYVLKPGEGRKVSELVWEGQKYDRSLSGMRRMGKLIGSSSEAGLQHTSREPRSSVRAISRLDGRGGRGYAVVDGRIGVVRVKRRPRSGEVRRPARMDLSGRASKK